MSLGDECLLFREQCVILKDQAPVTQGRHLITEGRTSDNTAVFYSPLNILTKHDSLKNHQYHLPITDYIDVKLKPNPEAGQDQAIHSPHIM